MLGKFLIDVTDPRLFIAANNDVIEFVRATNPFAHSDVGMLLIDLGRAMPGAHAYCPSYKSLAYVVLHTEAYRIFAIAFGQRGLAFRINETQLAEALEDGCEPAPRIGVDWIQIAPWDTKGVTGAADRVRRWGENAFANALSE